MIGKIFGQFFSNTKNKPDEKANAKTNSTDDQQLRQICEGFKHLASATFALKEKGHPRPPRGNNQLLEIITDAIYATDSKITSQKMAEMWAYDMCLPIVREDLQQRAAMAASSHQTSQQPEKQNAAQSPQHTDPASAALLRAINEKRKTNPLIGAQLGAKEVNARLFEAMRDEKGIHVETLLCALGSLAGFACQQHIREDNRQQGLPETSSLTVVGCGDGKNYYFGDKLNGVLAESQFSVWSLAAGAAQHNGCDPLPNVHEIFSHVTKTVGTPDFGIPRPITGHHAGDKPLNYVKGLWPVLIPIVKQFCPQSSAWPILYGFALQEAMDMCKGVIPQESALRIIMESAIPMSKIELSQH